MKVLLVNYEKDWGGAENVFTVYAQLLRDSGYKVTAYIQCGGELHRRCRKLSGVEVLEWQSSAGIFGYLAGLVKLLFKAEYSCIFLNNQKAISCAPLVRIFSKSIVVGYEHTAQPNSLRSWLLDSLIKLWIDKYICVSKYMISRRTLSVQHKCIQIYNGFKDIGTDVSDFERDIHRGRLTIGVFSIFRRWKGQHYVIQSLAVLKKRGLEVNCIFVGGPDSSDPAYYQECKDLISKLELTPWIEMRGFCDDALKVMREDADVIIQPSLNPDPLPTTVIEALMLSKPIIAFDQGGIAEMVGQKNNGILIKNPDCIDLADAIQTYSENRVLLFRHGVNSRKCFKRNFSLNKYRANFMNAIDDVMRIRKC